MSRERPARRGLGRGLGSLIPTAPAEGTEEPDEGGAAPATAVGPDLVVPQGSWFAELPADHIVPNRVQPRQVFDEDAMAELVYSIREVGPTRCWRTCTAPS
jgi:ParB family chromosome partitioning protein